MTDKIVICTVCKKEYIYNKYLPEHWSDVCSEFCYAIRYLPILAKEVTRKLKGSFTKDDDITK